VEDSLVSEQALIDPRAPAGSQRASATSVARAWWKQRRWIIGVGFLAALGVGLAFAHLVQASTDWGQGLSWERELLVAIPRPMPAFFDFFLLVVPWFGTNITLTPIVAVAAIWLWRSKRRVDLAMRLVVVQIGSYALNFVIKELFDRARPDFLTMRGWYGWSAYPSGHAIAGMSVLLTIALMLRSERGMTWPLPVALLIALSNLYSRLYLGVHWPTDVIGGALVGLVWLVATSLAFRRDGGLRAI
jgi:membrane-associated phospholipid phosphatase